MGILVIQEARARGMATVGAVDATDHPELNRTLKERGVSDQPTRLLGSDNLSNALQDADVFVSFTTPAAELVNIPIVANRGIPTVLGTTGFTPEQNRQVIATMSGIVPAIFTPNYSIGMNILFKILETKPFKTFPQGYDFSINEIHHTGKKDAPSGTAKKLADIIANIKDYKKFVSERDGFSPRQSEELEVTSLRAGGVPGIHDVIIAGPHEMLRIEHTAFSRSVFAQGAVVAAEWLSRQKEPKMYSMADVLGLS